MGRLSGCGAENACLPTTARDPHRPPSLARPQRCEVVQTTRDDVRVLLIMNEHEAAYYGAGTAGRDSRTRMGVLQAFRIAPQPLQPGHRCVIPHIAPICRAEDRRSCAQMRGQAITLHGLHHTCCFEDGGSSVAWQGGRNATVGK